MTKKVLKQVLGIDVAQDELVVCLGKMYEDVSNELLAHKTFANDEKGFTKLVEWVKKQTDENILMSYVMEATGVYHESLAYYLTDENLTVNIILPNKISNYARTLDIKTVTDKTASQAITQFGLERNLEPWHQPEGLYKTLRKLCRERGQLVDERVVLKNQLHAENAGAKPYAKTIVRTKKRIVLIEKQEKEIAEELKELLAESTEIQETTKLLCSIPGIGMLTAATVLGETNGFDLIRNKRQLTSYAGLDVKEKQSGTSVNGKPKISKKGNKYLRRALHMPALSAIRHDERYKGIFARLVAKHGIKMKAAVAVQRKLLEMMYTVYKTKTAYDKNYLNSNEEEAKIIDGQLEALKN